LGGDGHAAAGCQQNQMVPGTVGRTPETQVESQLSRTVSQGG